MDACNQTGIHSALYQILRLMCICASVINNLSYGWAEGEQAITTIITC